ncbi:multiple inositol polyphosphate phosphatase 1 isoform X1 [Drosophila bipectinata]|uniref:multiple inositol polyphosphate phosphatase 1 isoform X1 n=1 Tax=Drosophila bipectinata TaxID=42026 RepID=UPI001C8AD340|nr:multiple inositol polyphosphate phosphatase 1 [Drosophila bipectinata]
MRFFFMLLLPLVALAQDDDYCFSQDTSRPQTRQFSSKTAYQIVKGSDIERQYLVPKCEPKKMWIFHRHGTRLPKKSMIKKAPRLAELRDLIVKNYRVLKTKPDRDPLCQTDLIALQMWKWNSSITGDMEEYLTAQGYDDLRGTAKLYQRYYPNVLPKEYNDTYYQFRHTDTQRTTESFKAFAEGLFGTANSAHPVDIPKQDLLLRPYDYCQSYKDLNYKGEGSEFQKYHQSTVWKNNLVDISTRLGFQYTLDEDDIKLMYDMCRYEQAWQVDRNSVWCGAFLPEQVTVFEYAEDLKYYYGSGYGFEEIERLNCRLVQDLLTHLNNPVSPHVVAHFGHSTGLLTLITALGLKKDGVKLRADNYLDLASRRWKSSLIDPFASNFVAVKYDCPQDLDREKVVFFLNQDAVQLDWCNVGLCKWSDVLAKYQTIADADCGEYFCRSGGASSLASGISMLASSLVALLVYLMH